MTEFSVRTIKCIADWSKKAVDCNGNIQCLDTCAKELRNCLDSIFPYSKSKQLNGWTGKVNNYQNRISRD